MAFGNGRSCFPAGDVWFFLKRTPFSYKLSNVYQVFLGLFGRMPYSLPKIGQALQRPMREMYILVSLLLSGGCQAI